MCALVSGSWKPTRKARTLCRHYILFRHKIIFKTIIMILYYFRHKIKIIFTESCQNATYTQRSRRICTQHAHYKIINEQSVTFMNKISVVALCRSPQFYDLWSSEDKTWFALVKTNNCSLTASRLRYVLCPQCLI